MPKAGAIARVSTQSVDDAAGRLFPHPVVLAWSAGSYGDRKKFLNSKRIVKTHAIVNPQLFLFLRQSATDSPGHPTKLMRLKVYRFIGMNIDNHHGFVMYIRRFDLWPLYAT